MNRRGWVLIGIVVVLLWSTRFVVDPRPDRDPGDPVALKKQGEAAFEASRWWEAAMSYRSAFAVEDPRDPARTPHRAFLAHNIASAYVRIVTEGPQGFSVPERRSAKQRASMWIDEALALDATRGWLYYERGVMLDRAPEDLREPQSARGAYEAFVRWVEDSEQPAEGKPAADDPAVKQARERIAALRG